MITASIINQSSLMDLYPAAGMLVMAIEAMRQISFAQEQIESYRLEEIKFLKPLLIPVEQDTGIETRLYLQPLRYGTNPASTSFFKSTPFSVTSGPKFAEVISPQSLSQPDIGLVTKLQPEQG